MLPGAKPSAWESPTPSQLALLFCGFALLGIGEGGVRPCSIAFGADQFGRRKGPEKQKILQTYFNWFFNKACIIKNPIEHLNVDGSASKPRNLCTVEQVEGLKSVMRVIPLWSSGFMVPLVLNQSFPVLQAKTMDRHIFSKFEIPAGSFGVFGTLTLTVWSGSYDRFIVPVLEKITGRPRAFSLKQRMGIGIIISTVSTGVAAIVEAIRRRKAIEQGLADDMNGVVTMSAMWLVPQHCLSGLAEAFSVISQIEFYYTELPRSMASFGVAFWTLGAGLANLLGVLVLKILTRTTRGRNGRGMWLSTNLNKGHYDYYYWVLTLMGVVDFFYFLVCSWAYGKEGKNRMREEVGDDDEEESMQHSSQLPILR
ncbi:putative protein NRT1/ PTR FAMILY 1.2 [Cocos nucifera]|nr:putative protein NRT1/ PTR FAMILY 1.2 [Cocos nucifera]